MTKGEKNRQLKRLANKEFMQKYFANEWDYQDWIDEKMDNDEWLEIHLLNIQVPFDEGMHVQVFKLPDDLLLCRWCDNCGNVEEYYCSVDEFKKVIWMNPFWSEKGDVQLDDDFELNVAQYKKEVKQMLKSL